jgi:pimeloyl-ACP methyl ester carboxylesterase
MEPIASAGGVDSPIDRWLERDGVRIHMLDWGGPPDGPPVLLMHGVGGNALVWNDVAPRLRQSLPGHRILAVDGRDGGRSDHPATGYRLADFMTDVVAIADDLGAPRVSIVGHSRSGWLAASVAAVHPDRVDRIVLVDPASIQFASPAAGAVAYRWIFGNLGPFPSREAALEWARSEEPTAKWTPTRIGAFLDNLVDQPDGTVAGRLPQAAMEQLRAARADGHTIPYESVTAPTLLLVATDGGEKMEDRLVYAQRIRDTRVVRVDGTHFLHTDAPEEVARLVTEHLSATRPSR